MSITGYDFGGWATKNDLKCTDGRIIRSGAFEVQDGTTVPLVWNHQHNSVDEVLGHAMLENRDDGVYAYGFFNNNPKGQHAKECVQHGDVTSMSIWANQLKQSGPDVLHGVIREVSLVLAGANPGAFIESVLAHGEAMEDYDDEGIFYTGETFVLAHAIDDTKAPEKKEETPKKEESSESKESKTEEKEETIQDVIDSMTEKQRNVMYAIVADAAMNGFDDSDNNQKEEKEEETDMKHNIFSDGQNQDAHVLSHSEEEKIFSDARRLGSLREAVRQNIEDGVLVHSAIPNVPTNGMTQGKSSDSDHYADKNFGKYGFQSPDMFYPDYRSMTNVPEFISRRMDWVSVVMGGVHHTPFSRVKSMFANITEDEARARGYLKKGDQKKTEVFKTLKRVINPTTIYKMQKLDRDDILDITDFDVVAWIRGEMRTMLDEEIARAILIGDGREDATEGKISEDCILPVCKDVDLFNVKVPITWSAEATGSDKAKTLIDSVIRAHKNYRGSGNPTMFTTEDWLTEMLLLEDKIGHKLYKTPQELATALRVARIVTVEAMEGTEYQTGFGTSEDEALIAVIVNLADYNVGQDPKAGISMFDDFDIDFNQYKYLIETRMSGALVKPFSALTVTGKQGE